MSPQLSINDPIPGASNATEEPKIPQGFDAIKAWANGNVGVDNLISTFARQLLLASAAPATQPKWNVGATVLNWVAQNNLTQAINHGLGVTPQIVLVTLSAPSVLSNFWPYVSNFTTTQFTLTVLVSATNITTTETAYWLALGW